MEISGKFSEILNFRKIYNPIMQHQSAPLKQFKLIVQETSARSSCTTVTASNTVDNELIAYFSDSKDYGANDGLNLWVNHENKFTCLAHLPRIAVSTCN